MLLRNRRLSLRQSFISKSSVNDENPFKVPVLNKFSIDFHIRLLKCVEEAKYLIPDENCDLELEKLDELPVEKKSSVFWITYLDHKGDEVSTEKKVYIRNF
jgi:hypothetical protein